MGQRTGHNEGFDLVKGLLAVMVVSIHTVFWTKIPAISFVTTPIVRTAVPIFFLFSGYFFFRGLNSRPQQDHLKTLKTAVLRYISLYIIWFIPTLPVTLHTTNYFAHGWQPGLRLFINNLLFGETFFASWYIMALILGVPIIFGLSRLMGNKMLLMITLALNYFAVILSNYGLTSLGRSLQSWVLTWPITITPALSFLVGLVWIVIGKMFADGDLDSLVRHRSLYWAVPAVVLLYGEKLLTHVFHTSAYNDAFFMLIPVCTLLFGWILSTQWTVPGYKTMRAFSTIAYCFHGSYAIVVRSLLWTIFGISITKVYQSVLLWLFVLLSSWVLTLFILRAEKLKGLHWLKYSH